MSNLIKAIVNIIENNFVDVISHYTTSNRANSMGEALEVYIKDAFCNSFFEQKKDEIYNDCFSYLGNQNNPPDIILKNGDAIEIKKIENFTSNIALNSSYPKNKLYYNDSRITIACKNCETNIWEQKDIIYIIGISLKGTNKLQAIWFIYGNCYAATTEVYTRIIDKISNGIKEIADVEFETTNELAKVKRVDPLGITDLRIRGMWHIANPIKVFNDFAVIDPNNKLTINAIMTEEKYLSFPEKDREKIENLQNDYLKILDEQIKSPDNPAKLLKTKFITYRI